MSRCLALGCDTDQDAGAPMCARHWRELGEVLRADVLERWQAGEISEAARLVLTDNGRDVVDVRLGATP